MENLRGVGASETPEAGGAARRTLRLPSPPPAAIMALSGVKLRQKVSTSLQRQVSRHISVIGAFVRDTVVA